MTNLTTNFTLEELVFSSTAMRLGIDNTTPPDVLANLQVLADNLEIVRTILGNNPIHVDSGYRCAALNTAVGGAKDSAHMTGFAADILCPGFGTPDQVIAALLAADPPLKFDQLIREGTWAHCSFAPAMRQLVLTAHFAPGGTWYS